MSDTAAMLIGFKCRECGWPVVDACCNSSPAPWDGWDWWYYCSNKGCRNHVGEGVFQETPEWVVPR
jgi:hypothetical protein